jgi:hypothetical protein
VSKAQSAILWIGVMVVVVFLFTDANFRNKIFNRTSTGTTAETVKVPYTLADIIGTTGLPSNTSANTGTVKVSVPATAGTGGIRTTP